MNLSLAQILKKIRKIPILLILGFVIVLIGTTSFILPQLNKAIKIKKQNNEIMKFHREIKQEIDYLKGLPKLPYNIPDEADVKLILKELAKQNQFLLTEIQNNKDVAGNFINFTWQINNYGNLSDLILLLESIKKSFPVCYESYQVNGNTILIKGRMYYAIG